MIQAKPTKLKNGAWGATVEGEDVGTGERIQITSKSGKTWMAIVSKVFWSGKGISICSTKRIPNRTNNDRCRECKGPLVDAPYHPAMAGYCGDCAFDEFDC